MLGRKKKEASFGWLQVLANELLRRQGLDERLRASSGSHLYRCSHD
jgi:hypothetical protein